MTAGAVVRVLATEDGPPGEVRDPLAAVLGPWRGVEARVSGGFRYAPPLQARSLPVEDATALARLASEIATAAARSPSAHTLAARGRLELVQGQPGRAIASLQEAAARAPEAALLSDLAAAHLARAHAEGRALDRVAALEAADRAARMEESLPEARFNRALAAESLGLIRTARRHWGEYLDVDPASQWGHEARRRMAAIDGLESQAARRAEDASFEESARDRDERHLRSLAAAFPHAARTYVHDRALPGWADAHHDGRDAAAADALWAARVVSAALAAQGQGSLPLASIEAIEGVPHEPAALAALAAGHRAFRDGVQHYSARRIGEALRVLEEAREALGRAGSPYVAQAAFYVACCHYFHQRFSAVEEGLGEISRQVTPERCPHLAARTLWMTGLTHTARGRPGESLRPFARARSLFEHARDTDGVAAVEGLLASSLEYLGESGEAWKHRQRALDAIRGGEAAGRVPLLLAESARAALADGHPVAALYFRDEYVERQRARGYVPGLVDGLLFRASINEQLGRTDAAAADLAEVAGLVPMVSDADLRQQKAAALALADGERLVSRDPAAALERLSGALEFYRSGGRQDILLSVQLAVARAFLRAGRTREAQATLEEAIAEREAQASTLEGDRLRVSYHDRQAEAFDEMIALQVRLGRPVTAWSYAERARARALRGHARPLPASRDGGARSSVPPGRVLIEYALASDRLLIWVLRGRRVQFVEVRTDPGRLQEGVRRLRAALTGGDGLESWRAEASMLFDILVRPALAHAPPGQAMVFVPHRLLGAVPFGALLDSQTGRLLVQDRAVTVAWSARDYLATAARQPADPARFASALVVGNPGFDRALFPWASPLPAAEGEARAIAALYPRAEVVVGADATPTRFLEGARRSAVVHFGGHAQASAEDPGLSRLLLAPDRRWADDAGLLYARTLLDQDLSATRLVVLASCDGASGRLSASDGILGIARYFLAAGTPWVVASQWPVDDQATSWLMTEFHRRLRASGDPEASLRGTQLAMLSHRDRTLRSPEHWAAFTLYGGAPAAKVRPVAVQSEE